MCAAVHLILGVQKWWRRHLLTATGVASGSVLVVKTDVSGGMAPNGGKCTADEQGQELYIPMNNTVGWGGGGVVLCLDRGTCV